MTTKTKKTNHRPSKQSIIDFYFDYVLKHNSQPASVYSFAQENDFEEGEFYSHFGSFQAIEQQFFAILFEKTMTMLQKSKEYKNSDARNKLLSFYYTYFEFLTANRSFVKYVFEDKMRSEILSTLKPFKSLFRDMIDKLDISTLDISNQQLKNFSEKGLKETAWFQFLLTLKFWLDDPSASFEKTDVYIEKSVNTSFELINTKPLKSLVDFGKFVFQERNPFQS